MMVLCLGQCGSSITTSNGPLGPHLNVSRHWSLIRTRHAPLYSLRSLPGGARMNPREGAALSWANFRSATFLMLAKRGQRPVVNSSWVSGQAKDRTAMTYSLSVIRLTGKAIHPFAFCFGIYPTRNFIHLDAGRVRSWQRFDHTKASAGLGKSEELKLPRRMRVPLVHLGSAPNCSDPC